MKILNKIELLAPAGNIGGKNFSLRTYGDNFTEQEILQAVKFTHALGKKIYVTVNIFAHNADIDKLADWLKFLDSAGVDAVLISDFGVLSLAKELTNLELHISTQANITNMSLEIFFS